MAASVPPAAPQPRRARRSLALAPPPELLEAEPALEAVERLLAEPLEIIDAPSPKPVAHGRAHDPDHRPGQDLGPAARRLTARQPASEGVGDRSLPVVVDLPLAREQA